VNGFAWLDAAIHYSLMETGQFVQTVERRQGLEISCTVEIAFHKGLLSMVLLLTEAEALKKTSYGEYLLKVAGG